MNDAVSDVLYRDSTECLVAPDWITAVTLSLWPICVGSIRDCLSTVLPGIPELMQDRHVLQRPLQKFL